MKLWLDDIRNSPDDSWVWVRTYKEALNLFQTGDVKEISTDHDLGGKKTGYDFIFQVVLLVQTGQFEAPRVLCHSQNVVGKANIEQLVDRYLS